MVSLSYSLDLAVDSGLWVFLYVLAFATLVAYYAIPVRKAVFFEDSAEISGRRGTSKFYYSDILKLSRKTTGLSRGAILIQLRGGQAAISIPFNIRIVPLRTDLYSWLKMKIHQ